LRGEADTVVIDVMQLSGAGIEVVRVIKAHRPSTRVVVLTENPSFRDEALAAGADAFLVKGCSIDELAEAIVSDEG
jgi:DNA-binding NarL/FixJ family response regulator